MSKLTPEFMKRYLDAKGWKTRTAIYRKFHDQAGHTAKGNVIILHGYRGHVRAPHFKELANLFDDEFFNVVTCDLPNFGRSVPLDPKYRGQIPSFDALIEVAKAMTYAILTSRSKNRVPTFLIGYSVGALTILRFLEKYLGIQRFIAGVVFISLPLHVEQNADERILRYRHVLEPLFGILAHALPHMPVAKYAPDEFSQTDADHFKGDMSAVTANEILRASKKARESVGRINISALFVHGALDYVAPLSSVMDAYHGIATIPELKQIIVYNEVDHYVLQRHRKAIIDIVEWVKVRAEANPTLPIQNDEFSEGLIERSVRELFVIVFSALAQILLLFWGVTQGTYQRFRASVRRLF